MNKSYLQYLEWISRVLISRLLERKGIPEEAAARTIKRTPGSLAEELIWKSWWLIYVVRANVSRADSYMTKGKWKSSVKITRGFHFKHIIDWQTDLQS